MYEQSELDYNDPAAYADLILNMDQEVYLNAIRSKRTMDLII